jgi:hypothetical protein
MFRNHSIGTSKNFIDPTLRIQISVVLNEYATFNCSHTGDQRKPLGQGGHTLGIGIGIHPSVVSRVADVISVIVDTCSAFVVHLPWFDRHEISIVVVRK